MTQSFVKEVFHHLHAIPEKSSYEFKTSAYIESCLKKMSLNVKSGFAGTAVLAELDSGKEGPTLAIRADMDALEFFINGEIQLIHACGHDANSSMVLATAKELSEVGIERGKVLFVFQPAEETGVGAKLVCDSGVLDDVDEMVGIHFRSVEDVKLGQATPALTHGASGSMTFKITGESAHGSRPYLGINSAEAAVLAINAINSVKVDSRVPHTAKVTNIETGGNARNIIPESTMFKLDIRAKENAVMRSLTDKITHAVKCSVEALGAKAELLNCSWRPAAEFNGYMVKCVEEAIINVLGDSLPPIVTPGGEDFHIYTQELNVKTAYIGLGADLKPGLHKPDMTFDLSALEDGRNILVEFVNKRLGVKRD